MPKTPMNKNDLAQPWENHVRNSGKVTRMKPVSESHAVYHAADNHLWAGVHALDAGHGNLAELHPNVRAEVISFM